MDELLKLIADVLGEGFDDETRARIEAAAKAAIDASSASELDSLRLELKRAKAEANKATKKAADFEAKLADASGNADDRLTELRASLETERGRVSDLEAELVRRKLRRRVDHALRSAELPEDRREAALGLIKLEGVELDDEAEGGLVGMATALEDLKSKFGFLWESETETKGQGHGGSRAGAKPGAKPPKPKTQNVTDAVLDGMTQAFRTRGIKLRAVEG